MSKRRKTKHRYHTQDVIDHILDYHQENDYWIDNSRLNRYLYILQAFYLNLDIKLIDEEFECWHYGPCVSRVYRNFMHNGASPITKKDMAYRENTLLEESLTIKDKAIINEICDKLQKVGRTELNKATMEYGAYSKYYDEDVEVVIPEHKIKEFFN